MRGCTVLLVETTTRRRRRAHRLDHVVAGAVDELARTDERREVRAASAEPRREEHRIGLVGFELSEGVIGHLAVTQDLAILQLEIA